MLTTTLTLLLCAAPAAAQTYAPTPPVLRQPEFRCEGAARIADPKLPDGDAWVDVHLLYTPAAPATFEVLRQGVVVATPWQGTLPGGTPTRLTWNGRNAGGHRAPLGDYVMRVQTAGFAPIERPLTLVRLGVTEIEAQDGPGLDDEFQMVYFMKGVSYAFYATPAIHEYVNGARVGELADLDLNDGSPRPVVGVHSDTAMPVMNGADYETFTHNYPLSYVMGARPRLELTFGATCIGPMGSVSGAGYPVPGFQIRVVADGADTVPGAWLATPGGTALLDLDALPTEVGRHDRDLAVRWEYRDLADPQWREIPGAQTIPLRFYTLLGPPVFKAGASGIQYTGPWVEVAEYVSSWKNTLGLATADQLGLTEVHIKGFFGQNGGIPTAIEGVKYDAYPLGGDGGATHYYVFGANVMSLSRLLNAHASGVYVNCSDNMGATTTMLSMMGAVGMRPVRLGNMTLRAIWGIGAPGYTLNLWGSGHSFSYHHIVTDDGAVTVSDSCMQLDEDGNASALPGIPGWNVRRPWAGPTGYDVLSSTNTVSKNLEVLPGVQ
jgi:hypothetical protein